MSIYLSYKLFSKKKAVREIMGYYLKSVIYDFYYLDTVDNLRV